MKKKITLSLLLSLFGSIMIAEECCCPPFALSALYLQTKPASFREDLEGQHFKFNEAEVTFNYTYSWDDINGVRLGAGYMANTLGWQENPFFTEEKFDYVSFLGGFYTKAFPNFLWSATEIAYLDTQVLDFVDYALYQTILQGKYHCSSALTFDAGFILELGLHKQMIWPILGFEWEIDDTWRLGAVYPFDLALEYRPFSYLTFAAALRFLRSEHRVNVTEPVVHPIFEYQSWGGEAEVLIKPIAGLCVKGFIGSTLHGDFKVANENNHDATHFKLDSTLYAGASANWFF